MPSPIMIDDTDIIPASSAWRMPLCLRARNPVIEGLEWNEFTQEKLLSASSVSIHNESNHVVIGGTSFKDVCKVIALPSRSAESEYSVCATFNQPAPFTDLSWVGNHLVCASIDGQVFRYTLRPYRPSVSQDKFDVYIHSKLKGMTPNAPPTGKLPHTTTINRVCLCPNPQVLSFVSTENQNMHLWELEHTKQATVSKKVSDWPVFAVDWSPFNSNLIALGGAAKSVKVIDLRILSSDASNTTPVVWKKDDAHIGYIRDTKWHPFLQHWLATTGDDGRINIWDLRFNTQQPMITLDDHLSGVRKINWSPIHPEIILSGGNDRNFKFWSAEVEPHNVVVSRTLESPINYVGFARNDGFRAFAVCADGGLVCAQMLTPFLVPLVHHHTKFSAPLDVEERDVERLIYERDFNKAFTKAVSLAERNAVNNKPEKALPLLDLCALPTNSSSKDNSNTTWIGSQIATHPTQAQKIFLNEMHQYSYFIPPNFTDRFTVEIPLALTNQIKQLRLNLELQLFVKGSKGDNLWNVKKDVLDLLQREITSIPLGILVGIVKVLMSWDFLHAIEYVVELGDIFGIFGDFTSFLPIARLIFYPTVFETEKIEDKDDDASSSDEESPVQSRTTTPSTIAAKPTLTHRTSVASSMGAPALTQKASVSSSMGARKDLNASKALSPSLDDPRLLAILKDRENVIDQLVFMRKFFKILWAPPAFDTSPRKSKVEKEKEKNEEEEEADENENEEKSKSKNVTNTEEIHAKVSKSIVDFVNDNIPSPYILNSSIIRIYLGALLANQQFDHIFVVGMPLSAAISGTPFREFLEDTLAYAAPRFIKLIKESQVRDKTAPWETSRYFKGLSMVINVLCNCKPEPAEFLDMETVTSSIKPLNLEIENSLIQLMNHPDPALGTTGEVQASQKAKSMLAVVKTLTRGKELTGVDGWEKELKKFISTLNSYG